MIRITITRAGAPMGEHLLQGEITVGRAPDRDIILADPQVSRLHLVVHESGGECWVIDQGSRNGTMVDGRRLTKNMSTPWVHGQELAIREFVLVAHPVVEELDYEKTFVVAPGDPPAPVPTPAGNQVVNPDPAPVPAPFPTPSPPNWATPPERVVPEPVPPAQTGAGGPGSAHLNAQLLPAGPAVEEWTSGDRTFVVAQVIRETHDVNTFRFVPEEPVSLRFLPGQFVGVTVEIDGKPVRRSYSVSSSPSRPMALDVTVKRAPGGLVSNWMADHLSVGDRVSLRAPAGRFSCFNQPTSKVLFLAAGIGITPLMGMLRWIADVSATVDVVVLNSVRTPDDLIFGRELESIAARHPNVSIAATVTQSRTCADGWLGLSGRVDRPRLDAVVPDLLEREVFMCGPSSFSTAMLDQLQGAGVPKERIHQESFGARPAPKTRTVPAVKPESAEPVMGPDGSFGTMIIENFEVPGAEPGAGSHPGPGESARSPLPDEDVDVAQTYVPPGMASAAGDAAPQTAAAPEPDSFDAGQTYIPPRADGAAAPGVVAGGKTLRLRNSGLEASIEEGQTLLEVAERAGAGIMSSCRKGKCGTCRTRKLSGEVTIAEHDLTPEELEEGWIYPCMSHAHTDVVLEA